MGAFPARLALLFHVLAGAHHRIALPFDVAIYIRRQLGPGGTPHLGGRSRQLVAHVAGLASNRVWHEAAVSLGERSNRRRQVPGVPQALWRGKDSVVSESGGLLGSRHHLLCRLGHPLLPADAMVEERRSRRNHARQVRQNSESERLWFLRLLDRKSTRLNS